MASIKSNTPTKRSKYKQGFYELVNPQKYIGDPSKIIYRSSWEFRFCRYCDLSDNVVGWSSEPFSIPYISPIDNKEHKYWIDFFIRISRNNKEQNYIVEIKPEASLKKPTFSGTQTMKKLKIFNYEAKLFLVNTAKFLAAKRHAESIGYKFIIATEEFLFSNFNN